MLSISREKRLRCRLVRLERHTQAKQKRLRLRMEKRRLVLNGNDRRYWRVMSRELKTIWRQNRARLPKPLRQKGRSWLREHLKARNYQVLLRLYLWLLSAGNDYFRDECDPLLERYR